MKNNNTSYTIAIIGNPNSGKTTIFNALTGLNQKVGNYPGVTVEKVIGHYYDSKKNRVEVIDLPGTYSLNAVSPDEIIARKVLLGLLENTPQIDVVVVVLDANALERNLFLATQALELGKPVVFALNMIDEAQKQGKDIEPRRLSSYLNSAVIPTVGVLSKGITQLKEAIRTAVGSTPQNSLISLPLEVQKSVKAIADRLKNHISLPAIALESEALRLLSIEDLNSLYDNFENIELLQELIVQERNRLASLSINWSSVEAEARYKFAQKAVGGSVVITRLKDQQNFTETVDSILLHKIWGPILFVIIMLLVFQSVFSWATPLMSLIEQTFAWLQNFLSQYIIDDTLKSLVIDGIIGGVGGVVAFLPQILILFLYISILERTGYMARIAFIMDRLMSSIGLHGKSFVPMLSGFACTIPGIMACRTIENWRDRLVTIMVLPLITCSARLPVYVLLIALFVPNTQYGPFTLQGLVMTAMYFIGILGAMLMAFLFKSTLFRAKSPPLLLELPSYKLPLIKDILLDLLHRAGVFLTKAGTIILGLSIILWFIFHFPQVQPPAQPPENVLKEIETQIQLRQQENPQLEPQQLREELIENWLQEYRLTHSYAGYLGKLIEPVIQPLGFNWKIGIGLIASFAAREVFVSTMSIVYGLGEESSEADKRLRDRILEDRQPDGSPTFTPPVAASLLVFFAFSLQCLATVGVVYRETNSLMWTSFQLLYTTIFAWLSSFVVYQLGIRLFNA